MNKIRTLFYKGYASYVFDKAVRKCKELHEKTGSDVALSINAVGELVIFDEVPVSKDILGRRKRKKFVGECLRGCLYFNYKGMELGAGGLEARRRWFIYNYVASRVR